MSENPIISELKAKRTVDDFSYFCEGDIEPTLNKKIHTLILRTEDFIVYLDEELYVEWSHNKYPKEFEDKFDEIINRMSNLEINSIHLLNGKQLLPFRRLLGESVARILYDKNYEAANKILDDAQVYLNNRSEERARMWYIASSLSATLFSLFLSLIIWLSRDFLSNYISQEVIQIITFSLLASIGSLISIISRAKSISINAYAGAKIHFVEGVLRIIVGVIGASFLLISIKADFVLGFLGNKNNLYFLIVLAIVSGFSEHLVPELIKNISNSALAENKSENKLIK